MDKLTPKIAIITHSLRYNYGGIMQNYALQQVLKDLGYLPITLRLRRKDSIIHGINVRVKKKIFQLLHIKYNPLTPEDIDILCCNTDLFINKYINLSPRMGSINKHWVKKQHFDGFVIGSDQVLHPSSYPDIEEVYLNFVHNDYKLMYAASFGVEDWRYNELQTKKCRVLIKKFRAVSVRENTGMQHMQHYFGIDSIVVMDPTLLLDDRKYFQFIQKRGEHLGVVTYILDPNETKKSIINTVSKVLSLSIYNANNEKMDDNNAPLCDRVTISVEKWLTAICNADFVITDSYHGTLFAIIFKKQFIAIGNKKRGLDRFITILDRLKMRGRLINDISELSQSLFEDIIDYDYVETFLSEFRRESKDFLKQNLPI
ncbi:hypothetical protein BRDCF_p1476 [Bacteroidales bacterium CF]|jgi:Polysaccharide pyruvyl transferase.|nr:hypothetical protein BRDCF_p1476 [Bacteroidales bacterium CF]